MIRAAYHLSADHPHGQPSILKGRPQRSGKMLPWQSSDDCHSDSHPRNGSDVITPASFSVTIHARAALYTMLCRAPRFACKLLHLPISLMGKQGSFLLTRTRSKHDDGLPARPRSTVLSAAE